MRLIMRGVLNCLFLCGVALCGLCLWPAGLAVWKGSILLDGPGLVALAAVTEVFLVGVATCAATAVALAQLDRVDATVEPAPIRQPAPAPQAAHAAASPAALSSAAASPASPSVTAPSGASTSRRAGPNPLK